MSVHALSSSTLMACDRDFGRGLSSSFWVSNTFPTEPAFGILNHFISKELTYLYEQFYDMDSLESKNKNFSLNHENQIQRFHRLKDE